MVKEDNSSMVKKAFITGITGQDGTLLAQSLIAKGLDVIGVTRKENYQDNALPADKINILDQCDIRSFDITSPIEIENIIKKIKPDYIYHLAACHHNSSGANELDLKVVDQMTNSNLVSTQNIINGILTHSKKSKLFFAGTSQMYTAANSENQKINEATEFSASSLYGLSKVWAYNLIQYYRNHHSLWGCSGILFNHESHFRTNNFITRLITEGAAKIKLGLASELHIRNTKACADWSHANDFVSGMQLMLDSNQPKDYILASGMAHSVKDILDIAFNHLGLNWHDYVSSDNENHSNNSALVGDSSLIKQDLQWVNSISLKETIVEMLKYDLKKLETHKK